MPRKHLYQKDYELLEEFDERGSVHYSTRYIGKYYRFDRESGRVKAFAGRLLFLTVCGWVLYGVSLLADCQTMHHIVPALLYVFSTLPLGVLTRIAVRARKYAGNGEKMERRMAEPMNNQYPPAALFLGILPGTAGIWAVVLILRTLQGGNELQTADLVFAACSLALSLFGILAFRGRKMLCTTGVEE